MMYTEIQRYIHTYRDFHVKYLASPVGTDTHVQAAPARRWVLRLSAVLFGGVPCPAGAGGGGGGCVLRAWPAHEEACSPLPAAAAGGGGGVSRAAAESAGRVRVGVGGRTGLDHAAGTDCERSQPPARSPPDAAHRPPSALRGAAYCVLASRFGCRILNMVPPWWQVHYSVIYAYQNTASYK